MSDPEEWQQQQQMQEPDDADFYENFDYFNPEGVQVDYAYEYPAFSVGGVDDYEMENDGDAEAERATSGLTANTVLLGTRGKRRVDGGKSFDCFYCMEKSDRDPFYIPDVTPGATAAATAKVSSEAPVPEKVIDRAFCLPECAMGWVVHEVSVGHVHVKEALIAAIMSKVGRYVKCPLAPYELLCRELGGLKLRTEAIVNAPDQAPENFAFWNGMDDDGDDNGEEQKKDERRLAGKALLIGNSSDDEEGEYVV
jgi:hypothetical protein